MSNNLMGEIRTDICDGFHYSFCFNSHWASVGLRNKDDLEMIRWSKKLVDGDVERFNYRRYQWFTKFCFRDQADFLLFKLTFG